MESNSLPPPKTKSFNKSKTHEEKTAAKKRARLWEILKSPLTVGLVVTLVFVGISINFYNVRSQQESSRSSLPFINKKLFEMIEWFDLKNQDRRLNMRGVQTPPPQVALLTIDDRSIEEIGRWPWSREKIAFVIEEMMKYGAKSIGFDIVFSEPQVDKSLEVIQKIENSLPQNTSEDIRKLLSQEKNQNNPDNTLAQVLAKYKDRIVLGSFNEDSDDSRLKAYQDYCRNEAFLRANAEKFVKLNTSFIVNDEADPFVDLEFGPVFNGIFSALEKGHLENALKSTFHKNSFEELNDIQKKQLSYEQQIANMHFCDDWLTEKDPWVKDLETQYVNIFKKSKSLENLTFAQMIQTFQKLAKPIPIVQHQRWTINTDEIQAATDFTGSFNAEQDSDGTIRKTSLFFRTGNRIGTSYIPSIALQTYLIATGYRANVEINLDNRHRDQKTITKFEIVDPSQDPEKFLFSVPVDAQARMNINYVGGMNMYPYLPAKELFNGKETATISQAKWNPQTKQWNPQEFEVKKSDFIKGKSFIFGATAIGVYDLRVTPFEKNYPGPETHVSTLGNLFQQNFLRNHPSEAQLMPWFVGILGIVLSIAINHFSAIPSFLITFGSLASVITLDQFFLKKGLLITSTLPGGLIVGLYTFLFFYKYVTEERKKKYLRSTFSKYVSPAIVDEILKDPENIELGGKKMRMSVFFSDVRGFTTISEKLDPRVLSDVLSRYLSPMTQIVFANRGTLDKYMGDALMAFFGAPIAYPDHAINACRCALQSLEKLKEIRKEFAAQGLPDIDIGIGINSAEMSVGNMGSDIVRNYTVMGDAVNLGSRLEGINKEYGTRVIISQFTYEDVKNNFTCREVDRVRVKGKNEPVKIYELVSEGKPSSPVSEKLDFFNQGFQLYMAKNFSQAKVCLEKALAIDTEDGPSQLFIERCEEFLANPPPENWDGVFVMKTK